MEIDIYIISRDDLLSQKRLVAATVGNCGQNNPQILRNYWSILNTHICNNITKAAMVKYNKNIICMGIGHVHWQPDWTLLQGAGAFFILNSCFQSSRLSSVIRSVP